jgi:hypothetical protein
MENDKLKQGNDGPNEIVDEENPGGANKQEDESGCWDTTTEGMKMCIKGTYIGTAWVFTGIRDMCGWICYPIKEQCSSCFRRIDLWMNPYRDATIHEI